MHLTSDDLIFVTGATGLVGSHVVERAGQMNVPARALVRASSDTSFLDQSGVETIEGDLSDPESITKAIAGATVIVHCAAKVGDWGPVDSYRDINVRGLEKLLQAAEASGTLKRFIHISSLGVYEARDHHGTDETEKPSVAGIDGYTLTKFEAEQLVLEHVEKHKLPATVLRPGFIYGPRDRTVLPKILAKLKSGGFAFLGSGDQLMNNTYVGNLVDAVFAAIERDETVGEVFNIHDGRLVTKKEFITTIAESAGYKVPKKHVPLPVARGLAKVLEGTWKLLGKKTAPVLSSARIKFLGLNLDFSIDKARRELGYEPQTDFNTAMPHTIDWFRQTGAIEK